MKKILILGHKGMLGNAVFSYLSTKKDLYSLLTVESRWPDPAFKNNSQLQEADFIINCIGVIPQNKPTDDDYQSINVDLPLFLESLGKKIIHPSTDCEFSGTISQDEKYTKLSPREPYDAYSRSKADSSQALEEKSGNTKIIRTSIIGHELKNHVALLDWFLHSEGKVKGYTNHYWNGLTTLEWAKQAEHLMTNWEHYPTLTQLGTDDIMSKYDILIVIQKVYNKFIEIEPFTTEKTVNKCLKSDMTVPNLVTQLEELRDFYSH